MPPINVIGALAIGLALPLAWWSLAGARPDGSALFGRTAKRGEGTTDMRELRLAEAASTRVVVPSLVRLFGRIRRLTPGGRIEALQRRITLAGLEATWPVEKVLAAKFLAGGVGLILGVALLARGATTTRLVLAAIVVWLGFFGPNALLARRGDQRQNRIQRDLADALDQLTMSVEAGIGFEGGLARIVHAGKGPLASEFARVLKEMQIGVSRGDALRAMAARSSVAELGTFVISVVQAEEYGLPIAQVLRVQAAELRSLRRQRAEEKAMKLPVKLIFPLGLCIFPALFIVLLGPGAVRIWRALSI